MPLTGILTPLRRAPPASPPPGASPTPSSSPSPDIKVTVRELLFEEGGATVVDAAVNPIARLEVTGVRLSAHAHASVFTLSSKSRYVFSVER